MTPQPSGSRISIACRAIKGAWREGRKTSTISIARMVREYFRREACDFEWKVLDALSDGRLGYALNEFSYISKIPGAEGRRAGFSGMSCGALEGGLIRRHGEVFERAPVLAALGFPDKRIFKAVKRWAAPESGTAVRSRQQALPRSVTH